MRWYDISPEDGYAEPIDTEPAGLQPLRRWTENTLCDVLALNPHLLGLEDHLPVIFHHGASHWWGPDMLYVDDAGRAVIIELKNEPAGEDAVVQAIAYGHHFQALPEGEMADRITGNCRPGAALGRFSRAMRGVFGQADGHAAAKRLQGQWADSGWTSLEQAARELWAERALRLRGTPPRMIVVAPGYTQAALDLARKFTDGVPRGGRREEFHAVMNLQLYEVGLHARGKGRALSLDTRVHHPARELTWETIREITSDERTRTRFAFNGFADHATAETVSLSRRDAQHLRLKLAAVDSEGRCTVTVSLKTKNDERSQARIKRELRESERVFTVTDGGKELREYCRRCIDILDRLVVG